MAYRLGGSDGFKSSRASGGGKTVAAAAGATHETVYDDQQQSAALVCASTLKNPSVTDLDFGQLRALLEEAANYKQPKDKEGSSELFKTLVTKAEDDLRKQHALNASGPARYYSQAAAKRQRHQQHQLRKPSSVSENLTHGGSLKDLANEELYNEGGKRRPKKSAVSARQREGGSLPCCNRVNSAGAGAYNYANDDQRHFFESETDNSNSSGGSSSRYDGSYAAEAAKKDAVLVAGGRRRTLLLDAEDEEEEDARIMEREPLLKHDYMHASDVTSSAAVSAAAAAAAAGGGGGNANAMDAEIGPITKQQQHADEKQQMVRRTFTSEAKIHVDETIMFPMDFHELPAPTIAPAQINLLSGALKAHDFKDFDNKTDENGNVQSNANVSAAAAGNTLDGKSKRKKNQKKAGEEVIKAEDVKGHRADIIDDIEQLMSFIDGKEGNKKPLKKLSTAASAVPSSGNGNGSHGNAASNNKKKRSKKTGLHKSTSMEEISTTKLEEFRVGNDAKTPLRPSKSNVVVDSHHNQQQQQQLQQQQQKKKWLVMSSEQLQQSSQPAVLPPLDASIENLAEFTFVTKKKKSKKQRRNSLGSSSGGHGGIAAKLQRKQTRPAEFHRVPSPRRRQSTGSNNDSESEDNVSVHSLPAANTRQSNHQQQPQLQQQQQPQLQQQPQKLQSNETTIAAADGDEEEHQAQVSYADIARSAERPLWNRLPSVRMAEKKRKESPGDAAPEQQQPQQQQQQQQPAKEKVEQVITSAVAGGATTVEVVVDDDPQNWPEIRGAGGKGSSSSGSSPESNCEWFTNSAATVVAAAAASGVKEIKEVPLPLQNGIKTTAAAVVAAIASAVAADDNGNSNSNSNNSSSNSNSNNNNNNNNNVSSRKSVVEKSPPTNTRSVLVTNNAKANVHSVDHQRTNKQTTATVTNAVAKQPVQQQQQQQQQRMVYVQMPPNIRDVQSIEKMQMKQLHQRHHHHQHHNQQQQQHEDSRPAVIMSGVDNRRDLSTTDITFGFGINEYLLCDDRIDVFSDADLDLDLDDVGGGGSGLGGGDGIDVRRGHGSSVYDEFLSRFFLPHELQNIHTERLISYVGNEWMDILQQSNSGNVKYYTEEL